MIVSELSKKQIEAIHCAYMDLKHVIRAETFNEIDKDDLETTLDDLFSAFPDINLQP